jgi:hypothetical protein
MRWLCIVLTALLLVPPAPMAAQAGAAQPGAASLLNIVVIEGEGAINNIRQRTAREPIVQVEDENHKPIAGAAVTFSLPSRGASGIFPNGSRTVTVLTNDQGRATAQGLRPNTVKGRMEIRVNASHNGRTSSTTITQTNVVGAAVAGAAAAGISVKLLIGILAVAGAAAAGVAVAATSGGGGGGGGGGTGAGGSTTISPGTGTVGPPR